MWRAGLRSCGQRARGRTKCWRPSSNTMWTYNRSTRTVAQPCMLPRSQVMPPQ
ncbi:hypothetical protein DPMN_183694 [Dreissena polymorpha]|uniref:Uncharacterized protein n=1 Tax=Dreissena polymorpha TaxID=45954 RepID=A0A9D4I3T7_DREPO|nr:hypothetical protein DPMN_183694 [Dreissena polymorpha]